ncbi:MAG: phosphoribosylanthranilate isomerase [Acidobacteriota bacterium]
MMVKVCGITRREDAEVAVSAGASAIGFIFYPQSPRYVTPAAAAALGRDLQVWKVGIFVDETAAAVESTAREAQLDVVQIYGGEAPSGTRVWRAFRVKDGIEKALIPGSEAVLLDGPANGQGFDWRQARGVAERVIVAGGLTADNVAEAIRIASPWGVDASSGLESAPGIKDHEKVRRFVKSAQEAVQ